MKTIMLRAKQGTRQNSSAPLMGHYLCHFPLGVGAITARDGAPSPSTPPVMFQCHAEECVPWLHGEQKAASPGTRRGKRGDEVTPFPLVRVPGLLPAEPSSSSPALGARDLPVVEILHGFPLRCRENPLFRDHRSLGSGPRPPPPASGDASPTCLPRSLGLTRTVSDQYPYSIEGTHICSSC